MFSDDSGVAELQKGSIVGSLVSAKSFRRNEIPLATRRKLSKLSKSGS